MVEKVLFVDDEPHVLDAYRRNLRKFYNVQVAEGAHQALEILAKDGAVPVIVSDMQMPEVNGVELLSLVKQKYPDTVRLMLTGNADQKTAIDAINTSDVHYFLNKPCPPEKMRETIEKALTIYQSHLLEKELLEGTVKGCITTLVELLSMAKPKLFGRVVRIKDYAAKCAKALDVNNEWEVETVSLLSQIGLISLPDSILDVALKGLPLNEDEQAIYDEHPKTAAQMISNIPRMEPIAESISKFAVKPDDKNPAQAAWPLPAKIVRPIMDLTAAESTGLSASEAFSLISSNGLNYDPDVLNVLKEVIAESIKGRVVEINVSQLEEGMELAKDIRTFSGALLIERGNTIGASTITRLINFAHSGEITEAVHVIIRDEGQESDVA